VRLIASRDYTRFASIEAQLSEDRTHLTVTTDNVYSMALDLAQLNLSAEQITLSINEGPTQTWATLATAYLTQPPGGVSWTIAAKPPNRQGHKRHKVAGPLSDALLHSQLIVYGTQDPAQTEANRLTAQWLSGGDPHWEVHVPVKADTEVTEEDIRRHTLVLIGNPESNALTRRMLPHLPVRFDNSTLVLSDGRRFQGENVGISLIHPHPDNPDEYLVLHAGVGPQGTLASRHLPRFVPDYLVYDQGITHQRRGALLGKRNVLAGGFFAQDWGWSP
ncbi:MAG: hypothetical protein AAFX99_32760, partial [Myxococcota bacterium]